MKRLILSLLFLVLGFYLLNAQKCAYCYSYGHMSYQTSITRVQFTGVDNSTGKDADENGHAYSDFTEQYVAALTTNSSAPLRVWVNTDGDYTVYVKVWIDWNHDCDFDDAGEEYDLGSATNTPNGETSNSGLLISPPANAQTGFTVMRVSVKYNAYPTSCEQYFDGEVEDYAINLIECDFPTVPASNITISNITETTADISWTRGDGDSVAVFISRGVRFSNPAYLGTYYNDSSVFGYGDKPKPDIYTVYNGNGNSVSVSNLLPGNKYYVGVVEYDAPNNCYISQMPLDSFVTPGASDTYCYAFGYKTDNAYNYYTLVELNDLKNRTNWDEDYYGNYYGDYTYLHTKVFPGVPFHFYIQITNDYIANCQLYVDWNQNKSFEDDEKYFVGDAWGETVDHQPANSPDYIIPPANAQPGYTRARFTIAYIYASGACDTAKNGEVEDYTFIVLPDTAHYLSALDYWFDFGEVAITREAMDTVRIFGRNLTGNTVITASDQLLISFDENSGFANQLIIPSTVQNFDTLIYFKYVPTQVGEYQGKIVVKSPSTDSVVINVSGEGINAYPKPANLTYSMYNDSIKLSWQLTSDTTDRTLYYATYWDSNGRSRRYAMAVTKFDDDLLNYEYPIKITKIAFTFFGMGIYDDTLFSFIILGPDTTSFIYKSDTLKVTPNEVTYHEIVHTLPEPITVTEDFFVGIMMYGSGDDPEFMIHIGNEYLKTHSFVKWTLNDNYWGYCYSNNYGYDFVTKVFISDQGYVSGDKSALEKFLIYRNGQLIDSVGPNTYSYLLPAECGTNVYQVAAKYYALNGTSELSNPVTIQFPQAPEQINASDTIVCENGNITLSYSGGLGSQFVWYEGSCGGTQIGTGNNLTVSPTDTTTYYGRWEAACGVSECKSITVYTIEGPSAPVSINASDTNICAGQNVVLSYEGGSGNQFVWYSGTCGGTQVGVGNNLTVSPSETTTYYGRWESDCGNSECKSITITVNQPAEAPTSLTASDTIICPQETTILQYEGGSGEVFVWYADSCGGTQIGTGNNLSVNPSETTIYFGRWEAQCGNSNCLQIKITVDTTFSILTQPQDIQTTEGSDIQFIVKATGCGLTYQWYKDNEPLSDEAGHIQGATNDTLYIYNVSSQDQGNYFCKINSDNSQLISDTVSLTVNPSLVSGKTNIFIYPNPAKDKIFIKNAENTVLEIYNSLGQKILTKQLKSNDEEINLSLKSGIYILKFYGNRDFWEYKIIFE